MLNFNENKIIKIHSSQMTICLGWMLLVHLFCSESKHTFRNINKMLEHVVTCTHFSSILAIHVHIPFKPKPKTSVGLICQLLNWWKRCTMLLRNIHLPFSSNVLLWCFQLIVNLSNVILFFSSSFGRHCFKSRSRYTSIEF